MVWSAIATLGSAYLANQASKKRNKEARIAASKQMAFQEDMSNTSYQRGMEDMQKAGLNPILAGKFGGASTPSGSTYNPENTMTSAVDAGTKVAQGIANVNLTEANTAKVIAETDVLNKSGMSFLGRNIEYIKKELTGAISNVSDNQAVQKALDKIEYNLKRAKQQYEAKNKSKIGEAGNMLRIPIYRGK